MDLVFLKDPDVPFKIRFNGGQFRHRKDLTLGSDTVNFFQYNFKYFIHGSQRTDFPFSICNYIHSIKCKKSKI